jgi:hypothetical protein
MINYYDLGVTRAKLAFLETEEKRTSRIPWIASAGETLGGLTHTLHDREGFDSGGVLGGALAGGAAAGLSAPEGRGLAHAGWTAGGAAAGGLAGNLAGGLSGKLVTLGLQAGGVNSLLAESMPYLGSSIGQGLGVFYGARRGLNIARSGDAAKE